MPADRSSDIIKQFSAIDRLRPWLRSEEHTSELQSPDHLVCRLLLEKKNEFKGVIADDLGPGVRKVYICFRPDPGEAGGVADQRIRKSSVIDDGDAHDSAGYPVEVYAVNSQSLGCFGAEITVVSLVVIPGHTSAELGNQRVREKAIVVETNAIVVLDAAALEFFFFKDPGPTEFYPFPQHDALPT